MDYETLGAALALSKKMLADSEAIQDAVDNYLDDHPEQTTTVVDGAISYSKLDATLKEKADDVGTLKNALQATQNDINSLQEYVNDSPTLFTDGEAKYVAFKSGSPVVEKLLTRFSPFQSGSGTPSSQNVRPINGYNGTNITFAGEICDFVSSDNYDSISGTVEVTDIPGGIRLQNTGAAGAWKSVIWYFDISDKIGKTLNFSGRSDNTGGGQRRIYSTIVVDGQTTTVINSTSATYNADFVVPEGATRVKVQIYLAHSGSVEANAYTDFYGLCIRDATDGSVVSYVDFNGSVGTVYGGTYDYVSGLITITHANIASYNGETLPGKWLSSIDPYADDATPTTGAQVVYELAVPVVYDIAPRQAPTRSGWNSIWNDIGSISVSYVEKLKNNTVTPEMFGAIGDGIHDDTDAFNLAISSGYDITLESGKTYIVGSMRWPHGIILNGNGATIKRANLKLPPYEYTDSQINLSKLIQFTTDNIGSQTVIRDVTFDGNALSMWTPEDGSKYQSGNIIFISGLESAQARILIDNCFFTNNYGSGLCVNTYVDAALINSRAHNVVAGIVTYVGHGSNLVVDHVSVTRSTSGYGSFHVEINSNDITNAPKSTLKVHDLHLDGGFLFGGMSGHGETEINGLYADGMAGTSFISVNGNVVTLSDVVLKSKDDQSGDIEFNMWGESGNDITFTRCIFNGVHVSLWPRNSNMKGYIRFCDCVFRDSAYAVLITVQATNMQDIIFDGCSFENITNRCLGGVNSGTISGRSITFQNCRFDIDDSAYIYYSYSTSPVMRFSGNKMVSANAGIYLRGDSYDTIIMDNEVWDYGTDISVYTVVHGYNPRVFGMRSRIVSEVPTGRGFRDHDIAIVVGENSQETYLYTGNEWVLQS